MSFAHYHFRKDKHVHLDVVDGFRTVGILMVIWYHLWLHSWLSSNVIIFGMNIPFDIIPATGYVGVDILLFITGFGLFYSYARAIFEKQEFPQISDYVKHRFFRIIPSYYLAVILGFVFFTAETVQARLDPFWHLFTHLTFIHIFYTDTIGSISTVFWTLGTEMQFYIVFPLLAWCFVRKPFLTFIGMVAGAYIFRLHMVSADLPNIEFNLRQLPAFLDIYASGMMTAYLIVFLRNKLPDLKLKTFVFSFIAIGAIVLFFISLYMLNQTQISKDHGRFIWLSYYRLWLGVLFMILIISLSFSFKLIQWILTNRIFIYLSVISYNLFLWHYLILLELKQKHFPPALTENPLDDPIWKIEFFLISVVASIVVATIVTFLFERRIIKRFIK